MTSRFLLPDGEITDGVQGILPDERWAVFSEASTGADLAAIEFYVPPYLGGAGVVEIIPRLTGLRVIQLLTAGVDWILPHVPDGVTLCRAVGVHEDSVAEQVLASALAMVKQIPAFARLQSEAQWSHRRVGGLAGKRAVVLGFGQIGQATATRFAAFGVSVTGVSRSGAAPAVPFRRIGEILPTCDILVIILPLTPDTERLVDADLLALLPDGALVINVGRGPVVDASALEAELVSGRLGAVLDVTDPEPLPVSSPLWRLSNVLITPHVGGDTDLFPVNASRLVAEQIQRYARGQPLRHVVMGPY